MHTAIKRTCLVLALLALLAIGFILFVNIVMSLFDMHLDFSPAGMLQQRIHDTLGVEEASSPSLVTPMLLMLLGAFLAIGTLIIRQFIGEHRRERDMLTPQWIDRSRGVQVILGLIAAVLLALIGVCLSIEQGSSFLPYALSTVLVLRLLVYGVQSAVKMK